MTNKWPQSNKLFNLRNEKSCTNITRVFEFLGAKKKVFISFCVDNFHAIFALRQNCVYRNNLWSTHSQFFSDAHQNLSNFSFWCSITIARLDFVSWHALYGWCLSHGVRHILNARLKYACTVLSPLQVWQSINKVAKDFGALSTVSPSHDLKWSHPVVLPSLMSVLKHQNLSFDLPRQLHDFNLYRDSGLRWKSAMVHAVNHALKLNQNLLQLCW